MAAVSTAIAALELLNTALHTKFFREVKSSSYGHVKISLLSTVDFREPVMLEDAHKMFIENITKLGAIRLNAGTYKIDNILSFNEIIVEPIYIHSERDDDSLFIRDDLDAIDEEIDNTVLLVRRVRIEGKPENEGPRSLVNAATTLSQIGESFLQIIEAKKTLLATTLEFESDKLASKFYNKVEKEMQRDRIGVTTSAARGGKVMRLMIHGFSEVAMIIPFVDSELFKRKLLFG